MPVLSAGGNRVATFPQHAGLPWLACALAAILIAPAQAGPNETVLYSFAMSPKGANPNAGVIQDAAGNLYGTTSSGGAANLGVVFKMDTSGHQTLLHSFTGAADGGDPYAGVIFDPAGNLYGTTIAGGTAGMGVVYKLDTTGQETVLYNFTGGADGGNPYAGVILDAAGNLYGTTYGGGAEGAGVVYKLSPAGQETVLYTFTGGADGGYSEAGVILDTAGNLYGTTSGGGAAGVGVVFELNPAGQETVLHRFTAGPDGGVPYAGVIRDSAGNLFGTALIGGASGAGVVYKLSTAGKETVLYNFTGGADGGGPYAGVVGDAAGNLYGTTVGGGTGGAGVVYQLNKSGQETALYSFSGGVSGGSPSAAVFRNASGNVFGTTFSGGTAGGGVVFKLDAAGQERTLYSFPSAAGGSNPHGSLIGDSAGNFYGTAYAGGTANAGVVYKLGASGQVTPLYSFTGGSDGGQPFASVIRDPAGNLYGTTVSGGTAGAGVVYKLDPTGQETVLYTFTGGNDGGNPYAAVILDSAGNLYGTTSAGGAAGAGVVYKLDTTGQETVLYTFTGGTDGKGPYAGVIQDPAGNFYGTTYYGGTAGAGVVYKLNTAGQETVLYSFTGGADGGNPYAGVIRDSAGNLRGTAYFGGTAGAGVVYMVNAASQETVLYSFTGLTDGGDPYAGLARDAAGDLYGTASAGGTGSGVVYKLNAAGQETVLHAFTGADGSGPYAGVIGDSAGNLYGTTSAGGTAGAGVIFKLVPR